MPITAPAIPSSFGATVSAVSALALVLTSAAPGIGRVRRAQQLFERGRQRCVAALGEMHMLEEATHEVREAIEGMEVHAEDRVARVGRCLDALRAFRDSAEKASSQIAETIQCVEDLRAVDDILSMSIRNWRAKWRSALEGLTAMKLECDQMFDMAALGSVLADAEHLYDRAIEEEVALALRLTDELTGKVDSDAGAVLATLRKMVDFCEAHGIGLPTTEPA